MRLIVPGKSAMQIGRPNAGAATAAVTAVGFNGSFYERPQRKAMQLRPVTDFSEATLTHCKRDLSYRCGTL
jgi:hypothetical protein